LGADVGASFVPTFCEIAVTGGDCSPALFFSNKKQNRDMETIIELLQVQNELLRILIVLNCLIFGSLLFVHFGRFMRW
jgi:hypothetical protein